MYISLDVLMRIGQIALIAAGVIVLIYLVLLFKSLMNTFTSLQKTLDALTNDLIRLETPLQTVGQLTQTVDEVQGTAKKAAMSAIGMFSQSTDKLADLLNKKKKDKNPVQEMAADMKQTVADFQEIKKDISILEKQEHSGPDGTKEAANAESAGQISDETNSDEKTTDPKSENSMEGAQL